MPTIPKTQIATDPSLDLAEGFALFPIGTIRAGASSNQRAESIMDVQPQIAAWRFGVSASYNLVVGVCGPAYAVRMNVAGATDPTAASLAVTDDSIIAGFEAGCGIVFNAAINVQQASPEFNWVGSGWSQHLEIDTTWKDIGGIETTIRFDVLNLIGLIVALVTSKDQDLTFATLSHLTGEAAKFKSLLMIDQQSGDTLGNGKVSLEPKISTTINLLKTQPEAKPIIEALEAVGGEISFGPEISFLLPTEVEVKRIYQSGVAYDVAAANGTLTGTVSTDTEAVEAAGDVDAGELTLVFEHTVAATLGIALSFEVSALKVFSLSQSTPDLDLLGLLDLRPTFGPYENSLNASLGPVTTTDGDPDVPRIVFHRPANVPV